MAAFSPTSRLPTLHFGVALAARLTVASVLIVAGVLKFPGTTNVVRSAGHEIGSLVQSEAEILLGFALLFGCWATVVTNIATVAFIAFFGVALHRALAGEATCGCFGHVPVTPWLAALLDAFCVVSLVLVSRGSGARSRALCGAARLRQLSAAFALSNAALVGLNYAGIDVSYRIARRAAGARQSALEAAKTSWADRQIAAIARTVEGRPLGDGDWIVVFYSPECPSCRELLPGYTALATELHAVGSIRRVALVNVLATQDAGGGLSLEPSAAGDALLELRLPAGAPSPPALPIAQRISNGATDSATSLAQELLAVSILRSHDEVLASSSGPSALPDYSALRKRHRQQEVACGPLSLIAVLKAQHIELSPADEDDIIAAAGTSGTNLAQLKRLAERYGAHAYGISASLGQLRRIGAPAVVFVGRTGFAAITDYMPFGLTVRYPTEQPKFVNDAQFQRVFSEQGRALVVSARELPRSFFNMRDNAGGRKRNQPIMRLAQTMMTAGHIHGRKWRAFVDVANDGDVPLIISQITPSNETISTSFDGDSSLSAAMAIPPGEVRTLVASGKERGSGSFAHRLTLFSNDPGGDAVTIPVRGFVEPPVFFPIPAVIIDPLVIGTMTERDVRFDYAQGIDFTSLRFPHDDTILSLSASPISATSSGSLRIRCSGSVRPGWHHSKINARLNTDDAAESELLVAIRAISKLEVRPSRVWIRGRELRSATGWFRRFTIASASGSMARPVRVAWNDARYDEVLYLATEYNPRDNVFIAEVRPKPGVTASEMIDKSARITFTTASGESCDAQIIFGNAPLGR